MLRFRDPDDHQNHVAQPPLSGRFKVPGSPRPAVTQAERPERRTRKRRKLNRAQKWLFAACFGPIIAAVVGSLLQAYVVTAGIAGHRDAELAAIQRAGVAVDPQEFIPPPVADGQNAAPLYREATTLRKTPGYSFASSLFPSYQEEHPGFAQDLALRACYPYLEREYSLIERAADRPYCNWNRNWNEGWSMLLPEYADTKSFIRMLCFKAKMQAEAGDMSGAIKSIERARRISDHIGQEPLYIASLVQMDCEALLLRQLAEFAQNPSISPEGLRQAEKFVADLGPLPDAKRSASGDIYGFRTTFQRVRSLQDIATVLGQARPDAPAITNIPIPGVLKDALEAKYLEHNRYFLESLPKDPNNWKQVVNAQEVASRKIILDTSLISMYATIFEGRTAELGQALGDLQTTRRLTQTTLALLRQHAEGHPLRLPRNESSIDPRTGNPFHFEKTADGFRIWGVGRDGVDNHGSTQTSNGSPVDQVVQAQFP